MSNINEYIKNILKAEDWEEKCDSFVSTFLEEVDTDDESYSKKGHYMLKAIKENNLEDFLIAVCGWGSETLLKKAYLIPDDDGVTGNKIVDATFISEWDDGNVLCETPCKVNMETHEVFDIVQCPEAHADECYELDGEYILIDDMQFNVYPKDQVDSDEGEFITSFWYGEDE